MESWNTLSLADLRWIQTKALRHEYELHSEGRLLASLRWEKRFGSLATGKCSAGQWTFKRMGFLSPRVTIRETNSEHDLALFRPNWKGEGTLEFQGGRSFSWKHLDFWHSEWAFLDPAGVKLIYFKPVSQLLKTETSIQSDPQAARMEEFPLLVLAGWYLLVLMADDSAAASAAAFSAM